MKDQHTKITGYRDLTQAEIDALCRRLMNEAKAFEAKAAELHGRVEAALRAVGHLFPQQARDLAMARTAYEDATIRLVRAIANPVSPWFPRTEG